MENSDVEVTWLECILNRNLLTEHLQKENPDPPASSLLTQFVTADKWSNGNGDNGTTIVTESDMLKSSRSRKNRLLKLMAMQTTAYLSWDLDIVGKLSIAVQNCLMNHVMAMSLECNNNEETNPSKFLQSLYHRWVIRTSQINKSTRTNNRVQNPVLLQSDQFVATDSIIASLNVEKSLDYLKSLVLNPESGTEDEKILIPTQETFCGAEPDWTVICEIERSVFAAMIHLDVGIYQLYEGNTTDAIYHFTHGQKIPTENFPFFKISKPKLEGYLRALGLVSSFDQNIEDRKVFLPVLDKAGTEEVTRILLEGDFTKLENLTKSITAGQSLKEDTSGFSGYRLHDENSFYSRRSSPKTINGKAESISTRKSVIVETKISTEVEDIKMEVDDIEEDEEDDSGDILPLNPNAQLRDDDDDDDQLKLMHCEMKLFSASNLDSIKELVIQYNKLNQGKSIMSQNLTDWDLPLPILHAQENIPPGIFRDSVHMMMVVGRHNFKTRNYEVARSAFQMAINELEESVRQGSSWGFAQYTIRKLSKMLEWEILLTDITEMHANWGSDTNPAKYSPIVERSKACLNCLHQTSDVNPRPDIVDSILLALINLGEYQFVIRFDEQQKRWPFIEFLGLLARACMDLANKKDSSASYRDLWTALLPLCINMVQKHVRKDAVLNRNGLMWIFDRACSHTLFTLLVSALCKLHNNIMDDVSLQIYTEYLHIWPNILDEITVESIKTNKMSGGPRYSVRVVRSFILHLLDRAVIVGGELLWWRCLGDVQLASENPAGALKCYIEQLAVLTDFFEKHTSIHWQDNQLFRRMIKCCEQLQCFTQAVILCQFLTEVDYSVAFGMAQEKVTLDAQDSLYAFIWDLTILEFLVNLHTKRNEFGKRQIAVKMLGLLELNANNNEEIQREATNLRKSQFCRLLSRRYVCV